ncbi:MAG: universal stress protein [Saprospiraceae bacterium]|nr:universal stress protein [Saprospiraceae bacterium]
MKVLCPIDFSKTSVNACKWIATYLKQIPESEVHLLHCVNVRSRATIFLKLDDILIQRAEADIINLEKELIKVNKDLEIDSTVVVFDPKSYIPSFAEAHNFDLIVTGTKGLTALKDITVGSVTESVINKAKLPVLTIPNMDRYGKIEKIVLGVDDNPIEDGKALDSLINMCKITDAKLIMVHVRQKGDNYIEYDPGYDLFFKELNYGYKALEKDESVVETLTEYCDNENADVLCMIHKKKNWFKRLVHRSMTKEELFELETPLLVLPGGKS